MYMHTSKGDEQSIHPQFAALFRHATGNLECRPAREVGPQSVPSGAESRLTESNLSHSNTVLTNQHVMHLLFCARDWLLQSNSMQSNGTHALLETLSSVAAVKQGAEMASVEEESVSTVGTPERRTSPERVIKVRRVLAIFSHRASCHFDAQPQQ
jgi:hypothetical protein